VLGSVAQGASEFKPTPAEIKALVGASFAGREPLIVQFSDDSLDESPELEQALPRAVGARRLQLRGTHLTPLALDPTAAAGVPPVEQLPGAEQLRGALLADVDKLCDEIADYFEAAVASAATPPTSGGGDAGADASPDTVVLEAGAAEPREACAAVESWYDSGARL